MVGERRLGEILVFTKVLQEDRVPVCTKKRVNNRWGKRNPLSLRGMSRDDIKKDSND